jgi:hypothetical protein
MEMDKDKFKFKMEEVEENGQKKLKSHLMYPMTLKDDGTR